MSIELELQRRLERALRRRIKLKITDNRVVMFSSARLANGTLSVRLHHMFLFADAAVIRALAKRLRRKDRKDHEARRVIAEFVDVNRDLVRSRRSRRDPDPGGLARGRYYDLHEIYSDLNRRFFHGRVRARIMWGRRVRRRRKSSIKLGTYSEADRRIVISPALDRRDVPRYMVEWVVYHEMLHDLLGFEVINGINYAHTPEFRRRERRFPHHQRASAWERRNVHKLLAA